MTQTGIPRNSKVQIGFLKKVGCKIRRNGFAPKSFFLYLKAERLFFSFGQRTARIYHRDIDRRPHLLAMVKFIKSSSSGGGGLTHPPGHEEDYYYDSHPVFTID